VSMGWGAALKLRRVLENTEHVVAVELICAAQGVEQRSPLEPAPGTRRVYERLRSVVPPLLDDRPVGIDIEAAARLIRDGGLSDLAGE